MAPKHYNFALSMSRRELLKMMLAVGLLFSTHGPAFMLANSVLVPGSWELLVVRTFLTGSFSACIILAIRKPWLGSPVALLALIGMVSAEQITSFITGRDERTAETITRTIEVTPEEFAKVREKRLAFYGATALLVGCSWAMMAAVLNSEGKKRGRLETEMTIAKDIQRSLLPSSTFENSWCSVSGLAIPTSEVGGDYFDVVPLSDDLVAVIIADVSGHGVGAGIVSAMTKSALHSQIIQDPTPSSVLANLNTTLASITEDKTFVTCAYVLLNNKTRTASIGTAGHPPILHGSAKNSTIVELRTPNLALGVKNEVRFKEKKIRHSPGDMLLLYTDGIIEAATKSGEQFGDQRLRESVSRAGDPAQRCEHIIRDVRAFTGSEEFADDATVVCISMKKLPTPPSGSSS